MMMIKLQVQLNLKPEPEAAVPVFKHSSNPQLAKYILPLAVVLVVGLELPPSPSQLERTRSPRHWHWQLELEGREAELTGSPLQGAQKSLRPSGSGCSGGHGVSFKKVQAP
jgi:hypothetical protein